MIFTLSFLPISRFFLPGLVFLLASATLAFHGYYARGMEIYIHHNFVQTSKVKLNKKKLESSNKEQKFIQGSLVLEETQKNPDNISLKRSQHLTIETEILNSRASKASFLL